jgi:hypothetical protein
VDLYIHSTIRLHGVVLNYLSTEENSTSPLPERGKKSERSTNNVSFLTSESATRQGHKVIASRVAKQSVIKHRVKEVE